MSDRLKIEELIRELIREAIGAEREACAAIADGEAETARDIRDDFSESACRDIAAAIRFRGRHA